jgi:hypothetical protein
VYGGATSPWRWCGEQDDPGQGGQHRGPRRDHNRGGTETTSKASKAAEQVVDAFDRAKQTIREIAESTAGLIADATERGARPNQLQVEFGLKFSVQGNVIVAGASGEAALVVRLNLRRPAAGNRVSTATPDRRVPGYLGRVLDSDGEPTGTCFQLSSGVLATAWHVLDDLRSGELGARIRIDPLVQQRRRLACGLRVGRPSRAARRAGSRVAPIAVSDPGRPAATIDLVIEIDERNVRLSGVGIDISAPHQGVRPGLAGVPRARRRQRDPVPGRRARLIGWSVSMPAESGGRDRVRGSIRRRVHV